MKNILLKAELFSGLSHDILERIVSEGNLRKVVKGGLVFCEEDRGKEFFVLLEGKIRLTKSTVEGREIIVKIISPLETFAETILFESQNYPVTATAIEDSRLFSISRRSFHGFLDKTDFRNEFISMLMGKLEYLANRILYLTSFDVEERFFIFLSENYGKHEKYTIDMTKKEIAGVVCTIPETFSRLLKRLRSKNILEWEKNELRLVKGFWDRSDTP